MSLSATSTFASALFRYRYRTQSLNPKNTQWCDATRYRQQRSRFFSTLKIMLHNVLEQIRSFICGRNPIYYSTIKAEINCAHRRPTSHYEEGILFFFSGRFFISALFIVFFFYLSHFHIISVACLFVCVQIFFFWCFI